MKNNSGGVRNGNGPSSKHKKTLKVGERRITLKETDVQRK